jgi:hypothetical protein
MAGSSGPEPSGTVAADQPAPDTLELYKAVRAHELMLNEAASAYEHAVITRLAALNGAAAGTFLTLLGVLLKTNGSQNVDTPFAAGAVVVWSIGLLAASYAAWHGLRLQRSINQAHRIMREGLEHYLWPDVAPFVRPPQPPKPADGDEPPEAHTAGPVDRRERLVSGVGSRLALQQQRAGFGKWFDLTVPASTGCFTLGTVLALVAVSA